MEILNDTTFDNKVLVAPKVVLVDFFATWCGPCRQMLPIVEEVAQELQEKIDVYKVDVDEASLISDRYEIQSIPHLILFKAGKILAQKNGACSKAELLKWIEENTKA